MRKGRNADSINAEDSYNALSKYTQDLTNYAREGKIDPVVGRDEEIRQLVDILMRRMVESPANRSPGTLYSTQKRDMEFSSPTVPL